VLVKHLLRTMARIQQRDLQADVERYIEETGVNPKSLNEVLNAGMLRRREVLGLQELRGHPAYHEFVRRHERPPENLAELVLLHLFYPDALYLNPNGYQPAREMPVHPEGRAYHYVPKIRRVLNERELEDLKRERKALNILINRAITAYREMHEDECPKSLQELVPRFLFEEELVDPLGETFVLDPITCTLQIKVSESD
jgi:hypothetical protein